MPIPDNLNSIHGEEERIRAESLKLIESTPHLNDHLAAIHASMAVIFAIAQGHKHRSDEEKVVQYLGLRIFNSCASALKLGLSGYYQSAFALIRDVYETALLLDYFQSNPEKISDWESADRKKRMRDFGPAVIREALDKRDGYAERKRKHVYDRLSEYASHATAPGFILVAPQGLGKVGPFFAQKYLRAFVEEIVKFAAQSGVVFISFFKEVKEELLLEKAHFLSIIDVWQKNYFRGKREGAT